METNVLESKTIARATDEIDALAERFFERWIAGDGIEMLDACEELRVAVMRIRRRGTKRTDDSRGGGHLR